MNSRPYRMTARAAAAEETANRIMDVCAQLFETLPFDQLTLEKVAADAGVSIQTIIRRFGSKDGLMLATGQREISRIDAQRRSFVPGDVDGGIKILLDHYEKTGRLSLKLQMDAPSSPVIAGFMEHGLRVHHQWCRELFAPYLSGMTRTDRRRRLAQYVAICDVHTWDLLRNRAGLSRPQTVLALRELLAPLIKGP